MSSVTPSAPVADTLNIRVEANELVTPDGQLGPAAKAAAQRHAMRLAERDAKLVPGKLIVERDEQAHRFVQTVVDIQSQQIERRYPSESQLAFSRAISAYMRAQSES